MGESCAGGETVLHYEVVDTTPPDLKIIADPIHLKVDQSYTMEDVLNNVTYDEGTIEFETDLDVDFPGTYSIKVTAKDDYGNKSEKTYGLVVDDTEAPFLFVSGEFIRIRKGSTFNIYDYIAYGDNADRDPILEIDGKVDTDRIGEYPLKASLTDKAGNVTEWDIKPILSDGKPGNLLAIVPNTSKEDSMSWLNNNYDDNTIGYIVEAVIEKDGVKYYSGYCIGAKITAKSKFFSFFRGK